MSSKSRQRRARNQLKYPRGTSLPLRGEKGNLINPVRDPAGMLTPPEPRDPGGRFQAPKNPDFTRLMDTFGEMDDEGFTENIQSLPIDINTMAYVSKSRVSKALEQIGGDDVSEQERLTIMWFDAFVAGYRMAQKDHAETAIQDGSHRPVVKEQDQAL